MDSAAEDPADHPFMVSPKLQSPAGHPPKLLEDEEDGVYGDSVKDWKLRSMKPKWYLNPEPPEPVRSTEDVWSDQHLVKELPADVYSLALMSTNHHHTMMLLAITVAATSFTIFAFILSNMLPQGFLPFTKERWDWPTNVPQDVRLGQVFAMIFAFGMVQVPIVDSVSFMIAHFAETKNQYCCSKYLVYFWHLCRFIVGWEAALTSTIVIVRSRELVTMFAEFAGLTFLCQLNEIVFVSGQLGIIGRSIQEATVSTERLVKTKHLRGIMRLPATLTFVPCLLIFGCVWYKQTHEMGEGLININGVPAFAGHTMGMYEQTGMFVNGRPVFKQPRSLTNKSLSNFLFHCPGSGLNPARWVVQSHTWKEQSDASRAEKGLQCADYLIRSAPTKLYSVFDADGQWEANNKIRGDSPMPQFAIESATCLSDEDCNDQGTCSETAHFGKGTDGHVIRRTCKCNKDYWGSTCKMRAACPRVSFSGQPGTYPAQFSLLFPKDTHNMKTGGRPVYYSWIPSQLTELNRIVPGSKPSGNWYLLYYVNSWTRWMVADARDGRKLGGVSFTGDSVYALQKAVFNEAALAEEWTLKDPDGFEEPTPESEPSKLKKTRKKVTEPEPKPKPNQEPEPGSLSQVSELELEQEPEPEHEPKQKPEPKQEPEPKQKPEPKQEPEPKQKPEPKQEPEPKQKPEPKQEPQPKGGKKMAKVQSEAVDLSVPDWIIEADTSMEKEFTIVSEKTYEADPALISTWFQVKMGSTDLEGGKVSLVCADCRYAPAGATACVMGSCDHKTGTCKCEGGFVGPTCATALMSVTQSLLIKWGTAPASELGIRATDPDERQTIPQVFNGGGSVKCARCPRMTRPIIDGCNAERGPFVFKGHQGSVKLRPMVTMEKSDDTHAAFKVFVPASADCRLAVGVQGKAACKANHELDQPFYATDTKLRTSALCQKNKPTVTSGARKRLELDEAAGEMWAGRSLPVPIRSDLSLLLDARGVQYTNLPLTKAFELQVASAMRDVPRDSKGFGAYYDPSSGEMHQQSGSAYDSCIKYIGCFVDDPAYIKTYFRKAGWSCSAKKGITMTFNGVLSARKMARETCAFWKNQTVADTCDVSGCLRHCAQRANLSSVYTAGANSSMIVPFGLFRSYAHGCAQLTGGFLKIWNRFCVKSEPNSGVQGLGYEIKSQDATASESVLKQRCAASSALRKQLATAFRYLRTPYAGPAITTPYAGPDGAYGWLKDWPLIRYRLGNSAFFMREWKEKQESIEGCVLILQALQQKALAWSKSSTQSAQSASEMCGSEIQELSAKDCALEVWKGAQLDFVQVQYEFRMGAFDREKHWTKPTYFRELSTAIKRPQVRPQLDEIGAKFNAVVNKRYGSVQQLKAMWKKHPKQSKRFLKATVAGLMPLVRKAIGKDPQVWAKFKEFKDMVSVFKPPRALVDPKSGAFISTSGEIYKKKVIYTYSPSKATTAPTAFCSTQDYNGGTNTFSSMISSQAVPGTGALFMTIPWTPAHSSPGEWFQLDSGSYLTPMVGIKTQGDAVQPNMGVTSFDVVASMYTNDAVWFPIDDGRVFTISPKEYHKPNKVTFTEFSRPFRARNIRIRVFSWVGKQIALRMQLVSCTQAPSRYRYPKCGKAGYLWPGHTAVQASSGVATDGRMTSMKGWCPKDAPNEWFQITVNNFATKWYPLLFSMQANKGRPKSKQVTVLPPRVSGVRIRLPRDLPQRLETFKVMSSMDNKTWVAVENRTFSLSDLPLGRDVAVKFGAAVSGVHFRIVPLTWATRKTENTKKSDNSALEDVEDEVEVLRLLEEQDAVLQQVKNDVRCITAALILECPLYAPKAQNTGKCYWKQGADNGKCGGAQKSWQLDEYGKESGTWTSKEKCLASKTARDEWCKTDSTWKFVPDKPASAKSAAPTTAPTASTSAASAPNVLPAPR